ncbi:MAG: hypothetical protein CSA36_01725 [Draconibacterium sp.]|nr:MAG: hypothetical protein CSA36_01725 [Draconibacterium sp.]
MLVVSPKANSQNFLNNIKKKVQQKIEQKIEDDTEKGEGEVADKQSDRGSAVSRDDKPDNKRKNDSESMAGILKGLGLGGEPVSYENHYRFNAAIQMHIESFNRNGKKESSGEFITHLSNNSKSMAYEFISGDMEKPDAGTIIIDVSNGATIMLGNEKGEKMAIVYGMKSLFEEVGKELDEELDLSETPETYLADPNIRKTGKTKNIAGYSCDEYEYDDEDTHSTLWITKSLKMNTSDFFSTVFKINIYSHGMGWGYMMQATTVDKQTGSKTTMEVTKVDKNSNKSFNLGDYQVTNLGNINLPMQ